MSNGRDNPGAPVFLRLRPDLRCSLQENDGSLYYSIEDMASGSFYRIGVREWELVSRLDGATSLADAIAQLQSEQQGAVVSPQEAEAIVRPLVAAGLVTRLGPDGPVLANSPKASAPAQALSKLNPFFLRFPLIHPDRQLEAALPWCRWLISRPFFLVWLLVVIGGGYCIGSQWQRFTESASIYLAPHTWMYLWLVWCSLKVIHEFFHGLVCKSHGGSVGTAGIALILFAPVAYVDVTSAWRFRSKWHRIHTSAAGIYFELLIAGAAAIVWSRVDEGAVSHICQSIVLMASLATVLFNANPLMRFDGYFILSDLLEIQNLYIAGQQFVRGLLRRCFLGLPAKRATESSRARRLIVNTYGVAAAMWRIVVCLSMILLATTLFHGAGLLVALFGVVLWFGLPTARFARFLVAGRQNEQPNRLRFAVMSAMTVGATCLVFWLPWPGGVSAPAIVAYSPEETVRTATEGFIEQVHVAAGQRVAKDQLLVTLSNDELQAELEQAKLAVQQSTIRTRVLLNREDQHAAYQAEQQQLGALQKRQAHLQSKVDGLQVRAVIDGTVLGARPEDLQGRFTDVGTPLLRIAREEDKEIQVSIPEEYLDVFSQYVGAIPHVRIRGRSGALRTGPLTKVEPQATTVLRNQALGGAYGGPLAVRKVQSSEAEPAANGAGFELVAPRFHGVVALPEDESTRLKAGQMAKVRIYQANETIGRRAYRAVQLWIQQKLSRSIVAAHGS